jgi:serine protease Do
MSGINARVWCAVCLLLGVFALSAAEVVPECPHSPVELTIDLTADPVPQPDAVNDRRTQTALLKAAESFIAAGTSVKSATLIEQLKQSRCSIKLPKPEKKERSASKIYAQNKNSVLVVSGILKCDKCTLWHAGCASGFVLTESGIAVTNYHVINEPKNETIVAATADGRVMPVLKVLAASEADDIAIVQLGGDGLKPVALQADAPVGSKVCAISHPSNQYFTLTEGIISRYLTRNTKSKEVPVMAITADFAKGSSGGPIFDEAGNAVGMVASTVSIYYTVENGKKDNLQMVLKHCVPSASILKLIENEK